MLRLMVACVGHSLAAEWLLVGGAPLNEEFSKAIGADAYCRDAAVAVETAKAYMLRKHNRATA